MRKRGPSGQSRPDAAAPACAGAFLLLAGAGNLTKAVGKGLGKPSFRIIQNHFALENNLGDISAKEEARPVWVRVQGLG